MKGMLAKLQNEDEQIASCPTKCYESPLYYRGSSSTKTSTASLIDPKAPSAFFLDLFSLDFF